ncbi:MAG: exo-alpha-sialidase [Clostridia bacterium]|nr:exo-alpha-sialidase [Clostridia bacterium]
MKCTAKWSYRPYLPYDRYAEAGKPSICRLAPSEDGCEVEWIGRGEAFRLSYAPEGIDRYETVRTDRTQAKLEGLKPDFNYKVFVENEKGEKSARRLFRTGAYPGTVVNYLHPRDPFYAFSGRHTCSPSIVKLPGGRLLVSMDIFDGNAPQNLTLICASDDGGKTWRYLTDIFPCFWGTLFLHRGELYLIGVSTEYGDLLIGKGDAEGRFGTPTVLLRGSSSPGEAGLHRAPMLIHEEAGRIWTGIEYGAWNRGRFAMSAFSADAESDLLDADNWRFTGFLPYDRSWPGAYPAPGAIEGNIVTDPAGRLKDVLRVGDNTGLLLDLDKNDPDRLPVFERFLPLPFGHSKFEIRRHPSGKYIAVGNRLPRRTVLSVFSSDDLETWTVLGDVVNKEEYPLDEVGFQYPAFLFEGDELIIAVRSAFNGAENFHDANYISFHRFSLKGLL